METTRRRTWMAVALLVGLFYFIIGRAFAVSATHARAWRLAAWVVCGVAYAAQFAYEHFALHSPPRVTAGRVAMAAAIGALLLALAGMAHAHSDASGVRPQWLLALVAWPAFTAVPAFLVALVAAAVLGRRPPSA